MNKAARIVISTSTIASLLLSSLPVAFAKVSVNISNNGDGSKTNVDVKSNSTTSYKSSNSMDANTRVEVSENGETKVFESKDGEIHYQSPDGNTKVDISNKSGTSVNVSADGGTVKVSAKDGKKAKKNKKNKKNKKKEKKRDGKNQDEVSTIEDMRFSFAKFLLNLWPF